MDLPVPVKYSLDEILSELTLASLPIFPGRILFGGEGAEEISSYVAGWMVGGGIDVIVLDGANRFNPYMVSSLARKTLVSPENLLKRIRIARAFTCYQMATMIGERLPSLLSRETTTARSPWPWVIISGPITTFLDEDVPEREIRPLFERSLRKIEAMTMERVSFLLFQSTVPSSPSFPSFIKRGQHRIHPPKQSFYGGWAESENIGRLERLTEPRRTYLTRRLFQFSSLVWRISLDDEEPRLVLEKGLELNIIENCKLQNEKCKFERKSLKCLSVSR